MDVANNAVPEKVNATHTRRWPATDKSSDHTSATLIMVVFKDRQGQLILRDTGREARAKSSLLDRPAVILTTRTCCRLKINLLAGRGTDVSDIQIARQPIERK